MLRKIHFLITGTIILTIFSFISCQDVKIDHSISIDNFNDLITETDGASYEGTLESFVTDSNEVVIKLKGNVNKLYILQRSETAEKLDIKTQKGQIIYLKDALVINPVNSEQVFYLAVNTPQEKEIRSKVRSKISLSREIFGFGLVEMDIENFDKLNFTTNRSVYYPLLKTTGKQDVNSLLASCQAGGENATSCSITGPSGSCSVTCSSDSGAYACCNTRPLSCRCIAGDDGDPNPIGD